MIWLTDRKGRSVLMPIVCKGPKNCKHWSDVMVQKVKLSRKLRSLEVLDEPAIADEVSTIVQRPDGYYWQAQDGHQEFGPFETYELAQANRDAVSEEALAPVETLQEAAHEIGISDWIDPETGAPAEGESPPHLPEE